MSPKSHDLPPVQCKDTLLLDYDHNQQYTKRTLINNWNRYDEPIDEDNNNAQMLAATFEQILSASKSIGDHFTFASERNWLQNENSQIDATDLFKLNVTNLKNGLGRLPFYIRQAIPKNVFNETELTDMDYRVNFFENNIKTKPSSINQNIINIIHNVSDAKKSCDMHKTTIKETIKSDSIEKLFETTSMQSKPFNAHQSAMVSNATQIRTKTEKTEDIQDWLDNILNED